MRQFSRIGALAGASLVVLAASPGVHAQAPVAAAPDTAEAAAGADATDPAGGGTIVVTGTTLPVKQEEIGNSLTVIDGAAIEDRKSAYLLDVLREVPGVAVNQGGSFGALTQVRIRGAEGNHVLVLVDGIEVSNTASGEFDFSSLLASNIERVEVLRGPQSGLYGSNALAGVINVITKGGGGPLLDAAVEYGSYESLLARGTASLGDRETYVTASANYRDTEGFSSAAGGTEPDGDRNFTGYLRAGARLSDALRIDGTFRYVDKHTDTDGFDFSGGPDQGLAVDDASFSDSTDYSAGLALTFQPVEPWQTVLTAAYTHGETVGGTGTGSFGDEGERTKLAARTSYTFDAGSTVHTLTAFADYENEKFTNTFPYDPSQVPQSRSLTGIGGEYRLALADALFLRAAVRHDDNDDFKDATTFSLSGSWVIRSTGTRLHASYGTGVTNPSFYEQFGFVPGSFVGNPNLRPEEAEGFDIGVEQRFLDGRAVVDVTYFNSTLTDEIASSFPSVINQAGDSDREGFEVSARFNLGAISVGGSYTHLTASDPDGTPEVRRPEDQASFDLTGKFGPEKRGTVSLGVIINGEMLDSDFRNYYTNGFVAEKSPLDAYTLARVAVSYRLIDKVEVFARLENAFDETYQETISYGTAGRSVYGGVRVTLP